MQIFAKSHSFLFPIAGDSPGSRGGRPRSNPRRHRLQPSRSSTGLCAGSSAGSCGRARGANLERGAHGHQRPDRWVLQL